MMSLSIISRKNSKLLINSYHAFQGLVPLSFSISFPATFHITYLNPGRKLTYFDHLHFIRHSLSVSEEFHISLAFANIPRKPPLQPFKIHLSRSSSQMIPLWCLVVSFLFSSPSPPSYWVKLLLPCVHTVFHK